MNSDSSRDLRTHCKYLIALGCFIFLAAANESPAQADVNITLSQVGNPGNAPDPLTGDGSVAYTFDIGTYDVTVSQYCTFLNAVANSDPYGLYDGVSTTDGNVASIARNGSSGDYTYSYSSGQGNDPMTYVSWLDAARFCNWLQNGEPTTGHETASTTEGGAYSLDGDTTSGLETRNAGAQWWIPSQTEWYKAAYYDPALNSGSGGYWLYPTQSNTTPGNLIGNTPNQANYYTNTYSANQQASYASNVNYLTPVGSFTASAGYYGTFDQGGDVCQWTELTSGSFRLAAGTYWDRYSNSLESTGQGFNTYPTEADYRIGFRVASVAAIPEPDATKCILLGASLGYLFLRRKARSA